MKKTLNLLLIILLLSNLYIYKLNLENNSNENILVKQNQSKKNLIETPQDQPEETPTITPQDQPEETPTINAEDQPEETPTVNAEDQPEETISLNPQNNNQELKQISYRKSGENYPNKEFIVRDVEKMFEFDSSIKIDTLDSKEVDLLISKNLDGSPISVSKVSEDIIIFSIQGYPLIDENISLNGYSLSETTHDPNQEDFPPTWISYLFYNEKQILDENIYNFLDPSRRYHSLFKVISLPNYDYLFFISMEECCACTRFDKNFIVVDKVNSKIMIEQFDNPYATVFDDIYFYNLISFSPDGSKILFLELEIDDIPVPVPSGPQYIYILDLVTQKEEYIGKVKEGQSLVIFNEEAYGTNQINKDLIYWDQSSNELIINVDYSLN